MLTPRPGTGETTGRLSIRLCEIVFPVETCTVLPEKSLTSPITPNPVKFRMTLLRDSQP